MLHIYIYCGTFLAYIMTCSMKHAIHKLSKGKYIYESIYKESVSYREAADLCGEGRVLCKDIQRKRMYNVHGVTLRIHAQEFCFRKHCGDVFSRILLRHSCIIFRCVYKLHETRTGREHAVLVLATLLSTTMHTYPASITTIGSSSSSSSQR